MSETEAPVVAASSQNQTQQHGLMSLIERALVSADIDVAKLEKLLEIKERYEREEARKSYVAAMVLFKQAPPTIVKDKHVEFRTDRGLTSYDHASLASVTEALGPALAKVGISYEWETTQAEGRITVTCILTHIGGHFTRTTLSASPDTSGGKNAIQGVGSAVAYLQRYTVLSATGMSTVDQDDDGHGSEAVVGLPPAEPEDKSPLLEKMNRATSLPALTALWNSLTTGQQKLIEREFKDRRKALMMKKPG